MTSFTHPTPRNNEQNLRKRIIHSCGQQNSDTDEYDRHVVVHEWFHYFEDHFSRSDSMGGVHGFGNIKDLTWLLERIRDGLASRRCL